MKKILFRCNQDKESGYGHFSRCLNLARHLKKNTNVEVFFLGNYGSFALELLFQYEITFETSKTLSFTEIDTILLNGYSHIVTDSYLINQGYINQLANAPIYSIFIDDTCTLDYSSIDLVINFRVGAEIYKYNSKEKALGANYFIFKPELHKVRMKKRSAKKSKNILLFFGGTQEFKGIDKLIVDTLLAYNDKFEVTLIKNNFLEFRDAKYDSIIKQEPTYAIEELYAKADFVINGGGLTKYECCYCLIPSASISTTDLQYEDSLILENKKLLINLGHLNRVDTDFLKQRIHQLLYQSEMQNEIIQSSGKHFVEDSVLNLEKLIN